MNSKDFYEALIVEVISFDEEDVIITSNWGPEEGKN